MSSVTFKGITKINTDTVEIEKLFLKNKTILDLYKQKCPIITRNIFHYKFNNVKPHITSLIRNYMIEFNKIKHLVIKDGGKLEEKYPSMTKESIDEKYFVEEPDVIKDAIELTPIKQNIPEGMIYNIDIKLPYNSLDFKKYYTLGTVVKSEKDISQIPYLKAIL